MIMKFNKIKKLIFYILTIPFYISSIILVIINYDSLNDDLNLCLKLISSNNKKSIPSQLIDFLIAAEDHRYRLHFGIDQYAIIRAIFVR